MHPILFRIPLPKYTLQLSWLLWAAAGIALVIAIAAFVRKNRQGAGIAAVAGALAIGAGFFLRGKSWDMGPIPIYSYGVMLGLSLVVGWYLTLGLAEKDGLPKETMANNYVVTAIAAVAGSRILYILTNLSEFDTVASLFAMRRGGLVAYGGFLGGLIGSTIFLRRHKIPLLPWADVAVPSLASGLMITRIGCYLFGCDFGQPLKANAPGWLKTLGTFPHWPEGTLDAGSGSPAWAQHHNARLIGDDAVSSLPVHPTQIYESLVGAGLLVLLLLARKKQKFRGQIFFLFAFAYGVCRYLLEVLRDDAERGSIPPSLPEHILVPLGFALLSLGYVIGFSQVIKNVTVKRVTQVAAFLPVVALFLLLKPEGFDNNMEFSTSQFIAITSGFAAAVAFAIFYKAALAHPASAMDLRLPAPAGAPGAALPADDDDDEDDDDEDDDDDVKPKKVVTKGKAVPAKKVVTKSKPKAPPKKVEEDDDEEDDDDAPAAKDEVAKDDDEAKPAPTKDAVKKDDDEGDEEEG
ncbi:MAG: prolipoprotein diacylglyceryl transferase family protein [Minicystis sp.]